MVKALFEKGNSTEYIENPILKCCKLVFQIASGFGKIWQLLRDDFETTLWTDLAPT